MGGMGLVVGRYVLSPLSSPPFVFASSGTLLNPIDLSDGRLLRVLQAYLAPPDEDDDPAVYQASKPSKKDPAAHEDEDDEDEDDEDDDDGPLLTIQPSFNTLLVVLRDPKVRSSLTLSSLFRKPTTSPCPSSYKEFKF